MIELQDKTPINYTVEALAMVGNLKNKSLV